MMATNMNETKYSNVSMEIKKLVEAESTDSAPDVDNKEYKYDGVNSQMEDVEEEAQDGGRSPIAFA